MLQADDAERALAYVERDRPKLVVVDVGLPGELDGFDVCRRLRAAGDVPVVMLTARDDEVDRVIGLEFGADDYVTKPFSPRELVARRARRYPCQPRRGAEPRVELHGARGGRRGDRHDTGDVARSASGEVAWWHSLSREFDLLAYLAHNTGLALSRQQLLDGVWGHGWYGDERTVDVHVRQLRKKLGDALPLTTVWGVGYRLA